MTFAQRLLSTKESLRLSSAPRKQRLSTPAAQISSSSRGRTVSSRPLKTVAAHNTLTRAAGTRLSPCSRPSLTAVSILLPVCAYSSQRSPEAPQLSNRQASELSIDEYHNLADETMDNLLVFLEDLMETEASADNGWEVEYNSGVMTLHFGEEHGTYVLNKQPPNKQIWLSSPISGPKRYDFDKGDDTTGDQGVWFYSRDGQSLGDLLSREFSSIVGREIVLPLA